MRIWSYRYVILVGSSNTHPTDPTDLPLFRKALGISQFDFTIAWTRILPNDTGKKAKQCAGLDFYQK
ncbi:hypothetical protein LXA43DRAFT_1095378 [Ganoderma leucocontextum]|nr:hypothetical protein LXA43DRAFT_1095378 [Ganoderma leucocontextum]